MLGMIDDGFWWAAPIGDMDPRPPRTDAQVGRGISDLQRLQRLQRITRKGRHNASP